MAINEFNAEFAKRLREARLRAGYTQDTLAQLIGKTKTTVSMYENGRRLPNIMTLSVMSRKLLVSLDDLVPDVDEYMPDYPFDNVDNMTIYDVLEDN